MSRSGRKNRPPAPPPRGHRLVAAGLCAAAIVVGLILFSIARRATSPESGTAGGSAGGGGPALEDERTVFARYGGSASCQECHPSEYALWLNSNHALAERTVASERDRSAFDPARSFTNGTQSSRLEWNDGSPRVESVGLSGKPELQSVARVIGRDPLRQFLVPFPGGRFQTLEAAYDPRSNEWFNVYGTEGRRPGEWGHWTGRGMNWNFMCAACHNTRLRRNYDERTDAYLTTMAEMSVGCEACHGPMKGHNEWQRQFGKSGRKDPTVTSLTREQVLDNCGFCHSRRNDLTGDFKPGDRFFDHFELTLVDASDRYYADGQVREEDYEYGSFVGSRMHLRGVRCLDCHEPHSYKTLLPGNWLCMRCHNGSNTNAPIIEPVTHSHHKVFGFDAHGALVNPNLADYKPKEIKETGGECVNCHMPQTVYMQRHRRHDHGFTTPDPLLTKQFGIPNACNRCHQDKDSDWSLKHCDEWYGEKMNRPSRSRAAMIVRAQRGEPASRDELRAWISREESPYWVAVAVGLLQPWAAEPETAAMLERNLNHTNDLVRNAAARALEPALAANLAGVKEALQARLSDPARNVRFAAAWSLRATLDPDSPAGRELQHALNLNADQPAGQMQKGVYFYSRNDLQSALDHFQKAVAWDPYAMPFRHELAVVLSALNRPQEAVATLEEACRLAPRDADAHYQLGLACNEAGNLKRAAEELAVALELDSRHARAAYNLGLAQNALNQPEPAIASLLRAEVLSPDDARIPYARATILARLGRNREATQALKRALEINPTYPEARRLFEALSN